MRQRFPGVARLAEQRQFARAMQRRSIASGAVVRVHSAQQQTEVETGQAAAPTCARLGIVAGKKLLRTSVRRNAAKRQIKESFRLNRATLHHADYVVHVIVNDRNAPVAEWATRLRADLDRLWLRFAAPQAPMSAVSL